MTSSIITHEKECRDPCRPHASRLCDCRPRDVRSNGGHWTTCGHGNLRIIYLFNPPLHHQPAARPTALPEFLLLLRPNMTGLLIPGRRRRSRLHDHSSRGWTLGEPCVRVKNNSNKISKQLTDKLFSETRRVCCACLQQQQQQRCSGSLAPPTPLSQPIGGGGIKTTL